MLSRQLSAGASMLCVMVRTQERLTHPLGAFMQRLGMTPPTHWLQDPHEILRLARRGRYFLPKIARLEPLLM